MSWWSFGGKGSMCGEVAKLIGADIDFGHVSGQVIPYKIVLGVMQQWGGRFVSAFCRDGLGIANYFWTFLLLLLSVC